MSAPLRISAVRRDGGTQVRAAMNEDVVTAYAEAIGSGDALPPITVYKDEAGLYWLADGFHRVEAHLRAGATTIAAKVLAGSQRDAILHAVGANAEHGLHRSNEDKRRAVLTLLNDPEWAKWSNREIADKCHVSHPFVGALRGDVTGNVTSEPRTYVTKHGTEAVMETAKIGKTREIVSAEQIQAEQAAVSARWLESKAQQANIREERERKAAVAEVVTANDTTAPIAAMAASSEIPPLIRRVLIGDLHNRLDGYFSIGEAFVYYVNRNGNRLPNTVHWKNLHTVEPTVQADWVRHKLEQVAIVEGILGFVNLSPREELLFFYGSGNEEDDADLQTEADLGLEHDEKRDTFAERLSSARKRIAEQDANATVKRAELEAKEARKAARAKKGQSA